MEKKIVDGFISVVLKEDAQSGIVELFNQQYKPISREDTIKSLEAYHGSKITQDESKERAYLVNVAEGSEKMVIEHIMQRYGQIVETARPVYNANN